MRIISGKYKGRNLKGYDIVGTRPTMNRVKESVFAIIQNDLKDSIVLDLFAGSGNLGFEALSNGSKMCYFNDNNKEAIKIIKQNSSLLNEKNIFCVNKDYKEALKYFKNNNIKFDIIFLDPPYKEHIISDILDIIYDYKLLNKNGKIICEYEKGDINNTSFNLIKTKKYGSKIVKIFS